MKRFTKIFTKILVEIVNAAHLPEYSTLKSFGIFSPKRFEPECSSSTFYKTVVYMPGELGIEEGVCSSCSMSLHVERPP